MGIIVRDVGIEKKFRSAHTEGMQSDLCPYCFNPFKTIRQVYNELPNISPLHWSNELTCTDCGVVVVLKLDVGQKIKGMRIFQTAVCRDFSYVS